jgi:hypothetical protein
MNRDAHASQDVLSETFLAAIRSLKNGTTAENVAGWLTGIARNKTADWYRQQEKSATASAIPATRDASSASGAVADVLDALSACRHPCSGLPRPRMKSRKCLSTAQALAILTAVHILRVTRSVSKKPADCVVGGVYMLRGRFGRDH